MNRQLDLRQAKVGDLEDACQTPCVVEHQYVFRLQIIVSKTKRPSVVIVKVFMAMRKSPSKTFRLFEQVGLEVMPLITLSDTVRGKELAQVGRG